MGDGRTGVSLNIRKITLTAEGRMGSRKVFKKLRGEITVRKSY